MKLGPRGRVTAVVGMTLALAACGSDNNVVQPPVQPQQPVQEQPAQPVGSTPPPAAAGFNCASGTLNGEGSSAQANAVSAWVEQYQAKCSGVTINYNATGSGAGIKQFLANQVDWAGSDSVLKPEEAEQAKARCGGNEAWNLPTAVGPVAVAYNLPGLTGVVLDAATIAKIFTGKITSWDDQALKDLNPSLSLPTKPIKVFFRSDESGTTDNFQKYLAAAGLGEWTAEASKSFKGGVGEGQPQNAGVQQAVKATDGGIGYMEYSFAKDAQLGVAKVKHSGGEIELTPANAGLALKSATAAGSGNDLGLKLNYQTADANAYPIILVTYQIVCSKGLDASKTALLRSFLSYTASPEGQAAIGEIGYGSLPEDLSAKVIAALNAVSA
ncbi:MAG: phosphate ABC transporter substrate-binding protein PstS [Sporichthyaceae bacterium]